jgi:DNA sulfur modification protein DndD
MSTIIKSIAFKNFYNYYGDYKVIYNLKEGLNIINADNGSGKSKLYNGFYWILKDEVYDSDTREFYSINSDPIKVLSNKAKGEGDSSTAGVKVIFENNGHEYEVEKYLNFSKLRSDARPDTSSDWKVTNGISVKDRDLRSRRTNFVYDSAEQESIINKLISPDMRSYALLQGEAIDKIVDLSNPKRLAETIEKLTDLTMLKDIEDTTVYLVKNAITDFQREQSLASTNKNKSDDLISQRKKKESQLDAADDRIEICRSELAKASEKARIYESMVQNTSKRVEYREKCRAIESSISRINGEIDEITRNVNNKIFDRVHPWLLLGAKDYVKRFMEKRDKYNAQRYIKDAGHNHSYILPEGSPDDVSLDRMLKEHRCFVCGRPIEEGSPEYKSIQELRNRSLSNNQADRSDMYQFFDRLSRSVAPYSIVDSIYALVAKDRKALKDLRDKLASERNKLDVARDELFNYGGATSGSDDDINLLASYKKATEDIKTNHDEIESLKERQRNLKADIAKIDEDLATYSSTQMSRSAKKLKEIVSDAQIIFASTKKRIYDDVLKKLEESSNKYYEMLTKGNEAMRGTLSFSKTPDDTVVIKVSDDNGFDVTGASEGFQRMKKIAVVMAIISSNLGDGHFNYPFIADAPFSAFGRNFIDNFIKVVPVVFNQSIIMIKELFDVDDENNLTDNGKEILKEMREGRIPGTFYVNILTEEGDGEKVTIAKCYR